MKIKYTLSILFSCTIGSIDCLFSQSYTGIFFNSLWHVDFNSISCDCNVNPYVNTYFVDNGVTYSPEGGLYAGDGIMYLIDPVTGLSTAAFTPPPGAPTAVTGLVAVGDGIFYKMDQPEFGSMVYKININDGSMISIGETGYPRTTDLTLYNGDIYYCNNSELIRFDLFNPTNSEVVANLPWDYYDTGLTASHFCNELLVLVEGQNGNHKIALINVQTGEITLVCDQILFPIYFSSMREHENPVSCIVGLELGCGENGNTSFYDCLTGDGAPVTGESIHLFADTDITSMTISIAPPIPDTPNEILEMTGIVPNIDETGSGTSTITLTNTGGASTLDFKEALKLIVYKNLSQPITQGIRTIEVQFATASGATSNVAEYFVDVQSPGQIIVDLGDDHEACEESETILDAANPGSLYEWSTGETTQTITIDASGEYIVTVSDGLLCPGIDTVVIDVIPNIDLVLTGDTYICENEEATLIIQTDSPFPLTVTIDADPGSPFVFTGIDGTFSFTDLPFVTTTYTVTEVIPEQPGCIEISDPEQIIEVYPTYIFENEVSLCDGDSIWLGYFWESTAGTYENLLESVYGCDSMVTTHITILPAIQITQQSTTCDPASAGVFITHLDNPNGCDTVVTTTITLLPSDTTSIQLTSCRQADIGTTIDTLINQLGCYSLIITTTSYIPPADSTFLYAATCDSSAIGKIYFTSTDFIGCDSIIVLTTTFALTDTTYLSATSCDSSQTGMAQDTLTDKNGCDSIVITTTTYALADTTYLFTTSCDVTQVGISQQMTTGADGCDSLVITTTTFVLADTTYLTATSCDPAQTGVSQQTITGTNGCDSLIITTTTLLPSDVMSLSSTTCDPGSAGIFVSTLTNQYGCDSVVTETITLLPSDQITQSSSTCMASEAGVFVTSLSNQYGCDSIITETINFLPGDTTLIQRYTCDPAEAGVIQHIVTGSDGCDSIIVETTTLYPLPQLVLQSIFDYNGYDISCIHETDGGAMAILTGIPPYTYIWSTNNTDEQITGVSAGDYAVTITDGNECTTDAIITLSEPTELIMGFEITKPDCFDQALGIITINAIGGVPPYVYAKDGGATQSSNEFHALGDGIYRFDVIDANGCTTSEIISIDVPLMISVDLGSDQNISLGDTTDINAIVNLPLDSISSISWNGIDTSGCENCLHQIVAPIITTAYSILVSSVGGCSDRDTMIVTVTTDQHFYIPNIFSPNGDGVNDFLRISADDGVEEIAVMEIYDRWGNLVFGFTHKKPDDPVAHWDGLFKGERLNPGVFTYRVAILYLTGETETRYGDITLIR